ncbi:unnamed protein product [Nezara viridula]|uniref:Uncharacterized protein n=1 Tax=Nezara viridula TaxID=85310 RepID=A0A9P0ECW5_NEZVI|nr:unnamed protein product [Nezara viridula]
MIIVQSLVEVITVFRAIESIILSAQQEGPISISHVFLTSSCRDVNKNKLALGQKKQIGPS